LWIIYWNFVDGYASGWALFSPTLLAVGAKIPKPKESARTAPSRRRSMKEMIVDTYKVSIAGFWARTIRQPCRRGREAVKPVWIIAPPGTDF
jgi:hypothetical protein